jgi:hypothetical protein
LAVFGHAARAWTADDVAQQLYVPPELAEERLADLTRRDLLQAEPGADSRMRYQARPAHAAIVERLAQFYAQRRVTVISFIFAQPNEIVRSFADAFKLRKEP